MWLPPPRPPLRSADPPRKGEVCAAKTLVKSNRCAGCVHICVPIRLNYNPPKIAVQNSAAEGPQIAPGGRCGGRAWPLSCGPAASDRSADSAAPSYGSPLTPAVGPLFRAGTRVRAPLERREPCAAPLRPTGDAGTVDTGKQPAHRPCSVVQDAPLIYLGEPLR